MPAKKADYAISPMRLQKYLAEAGLASRRKAEALIREGRVEVNDAPAEIGMSVRLKNTESLTLMMNKPKGVLCTNFDPHDGRTVFSLLPEEWQNLRLFCAGRLDKDSEGMLILTNDGDLANRITHPGGGVVMIFQASYSDAKPALFGRAMARVFQIKLLDFIGHNLPKPPGYNRCLSRIGAGRRVAHGQIV